MAEEKEKLLRLVNSSGFPFQLRIANQIRLKQEDSFFRWTVMTQEHAWRGVDKSREGFIDIIIRNSTNDRMVLECKRSRDADWVFLVPENGVFSRGTRARMMYVNASSRMPDLQIGWHDFYAQPESQISEFCVVRGSGEGQKPMLENLCTVLLASIESLALEESAFVIERNDTLNTLYIPVIVTNAKLQVCRFKFGSVSLSDGEIADGDFESVPFIRFCKTLSTKPIASASSFGAANRERERTVFVVQSEYLVSFLEAWHMVDTRENYRPFR